VVAHGVSALAAESVDDDGAGGFAGGGIEGDFSLLDVEGDVDDVERVEGGVGVGLPVGWEVAMVVLARWVRG